MRDTWSLIADFTSVTNSAEETKKMVDEEMEKGGCVPIPKHLRDERIDLLWEQKMQDEKRE